MVHHRHQHVLVVGDAEKPCPQRDLGGQVKRVTRRRADGLTQPACRPAAGINDLPAEVGPLGGHHHLLRDPVGRREQRAQALMAAHHIGQRRTQRLGVERARAAATPPPCCRPATAPATGRGTTTGSGQTTTAPPPAAAPATNGCQPTRHPPPIRGANWATVGASNNARTASSASRPVLIAAITRIADSESPPRSKNESSTPTRSTPSTWA